VLTILIRAAYVAPLLSVLAAVARRNEGMQGRLQQMQERMSTPGGTKDAFDELNRRRRPTSDRQMALFTRRITQGLADIECFRREPLGWREGTTVVWAGMRGAVTVAAAQTLPEETPQRSLIVLIAFAVAMLSLVVQGGTIGRLVRRLTPPAEGASADDETRADSARLVELLRASAATVEKPAAVAGDPTGEQMAESMTHQLAVLAAMRAALLDARDTGTFDADLLTSSLENLDASQIALEMRGAVDG
jgi:CPA1 family monovalent cation:H+ antiporter